MFPSRVRKAIQANLWIENMSSPQLQLALWVPQPILLLAVAVVMFRRRLHKDFPVFFAFVLAEILIFAVEFPVHELAASNVYFYTFWIAAVVNLLFQFKIIHEIFLDILRPYHALKDLGTALLKWAALIMILVSVVFISTNSEWINPLGRIVFSLQRCVRVVQCGIILFLLAFCRPLGVSWRRPSFGIALGFGIIAGVELINFALFTGGHISNDTVSLLNMGSYNLGVLLWLSYAVLNRPGLPSAVLVPQRWDHALMEIQPQPESESLIPMFEHMVDRALSKTQNTHA